MRMIAIHRQKRERLAAGLTLVAMAAVVAGLMQARVSSHDESPTTSVVFEREIVRILNDHCVACHAENGPTFRLTTYEDVYVRAQAIKTSVLRRRMPPWSAVPAFGDYDNANRLTDRDLAQIVSWLNGGAPRSADCAPQNRTLSLADCEEAARRLSPEAHADPHFDHWRFGPPDMQRPLPSFAIRSGSTTTRIVFDLGLTAPRQVAAWEYRPDDRRVTQAVTFSVEATGQWLGTWTPWRGYFTLPAGAAFEFGPGTRIVADIKHAAAAQQTVNGGGTIGLSFAKPSAARRPTDFVLELGEAPAEATTTLQSDVDVFAIGLDRGPDTTAVDVFGVLPNGATRILLVLRSHGFEWPAPYVLRTPVTLPRGTRLTAVTRAGENHLTSGRYKVTISAIPVLTRGSR